MKKRHPVIRVIYMIHTLLMWWDCGGFDGWIFFLVLPLTTAVVAFLDSVLDVVISNITKSKRGISVWNALALLFALLIATVYHFQFAGMDISWLDTEAFVYFAYGLNMAIWVLWLVRLTVEELHPNGKKRYLVTPVVFTVYTLVCLLAERQQTLEELAFLLPWVLGFAVLSDTLVDFFMGKRRFTVGNVSGFVCSALIFAVLMLLGTNAEDCLPYAVPALVWIWWIVRASVLPYKKKQQHETAACAEGI